MTRRLRGGAPRAYADHRGTTGRLYAAHYAALVERFGPFDELGRDYAGAVAALWVAFRLATEGVKAAEAQRAKGKGRRPSAAGVERLRRRQGLAWGSYDQAVRRLEQLAGDRKAPSLGAYLASRGAEQPGGER